MNDLLFHTSANSLLLLLIIKGGLILMAGMGTAYMLHRAAAGKRHFIWNLTFAALLLSALGTWTLPGLEIDLAATDNTRQETHETAVGTSFSLDESGIHTRPVSPVADMSPADAAATLHFAHEVSPIEHKGAAVISVAWLVRIWTIGSSAVLLWLLFQVILMCVYRRRAEHITDPVWLGPLNEAKTRLGVKKSVRLYRHPEAAAPMTWGTFRPVIVLPADAAGWSEDRRLIVLLHEMVHIRRHDYLTLLGSHIACAIYWCNPLVWLARRWALVAREKSCDDFVLKSGVSTASYAHELLVTAQAIRSRSRNHTPVLALGRPTELYTRITSLLDTGQQRGTYPAPTTLFTAILVLSFTLLFSCVQPRETVQTSETTGREAFAYVASVQRPELTGITSVAVSPDGRYLYTAAFQASTIGTFKRDPETGILTAPTFISDGRNLSGVVALRLSEDGNRAAATAFVSQTVTLFSRDPSTGELSVLDRARNGEDSVTSMFWPIDASFSPDGRFLYVISGKLPGSLSVFGVSEEGDLSLIEESTGHDGCFADARGILLSPDGSSLYITSAGAHTLTVLDRDAQTGKVSIRHILKDGQEANGLGGAMRVTRSADGRYIYVSSGRFGGDNAVTVFSLRPDGSLQLVQELIGARGGLDLFTGGNEIYLSPDGFHVFVAGTLSGTVAHFSRDPDTGVLSLLEMLYQGTGSAAGVGMDPEGNNLYVAAENEGAVTIYRKTSMPAIPSESTGLSDRREAIRIRAMLDSTWTVLRQPDMEASVRDSLQRSAAAEAFAYYLEHPDTDAGKDAIQHAMMMWGNVGDDRAVEDALNHIDPGSDVWANVLLAAGHAFARAERYNDYIALLHRLEDRLTHPQSLTALFMRLGEHYAPRSADSARVYFSRITALDADSFQVERARGNLYELSALQIGQPAPDFEAKDLQGQTVRLSDLRGKVVLLDFWATWCGPCLPEIPHLKNIYDRHQNDPFALVGISLDTEEDSLRAFVKRHALAWPQLGGSEGWQHQVAQQYNVHFIPSTYLIDAEGSIAAKDLRGEEMEKTVTALLDGTFSAK